MNLKKYYPMIFGAIIGALISSNYAFVGIIILVITLIIYRSYIKDVIEAFTETESDKIETILLIGIMGFGIIIGTYINNFIPTMLTTAWMIFMVLMVAKLSSINMHQQFELERKEIDLKYSIPLKEHWERMKRLEKIYDKPHTP